MTKFLNISTDNTLGGNSPSDVTVSSQKAIKEYIDNNSGSEVDNSTINKNSSDQLQAIGLINKNTANGATNPKYDWVGTLQEYNDQSVATNHPEWICYITDDVSGGESVYTKNEVNTLLAGKYDASNPNGYQANVIETVKVNGTALTPSSKAVDITVPAAQVNSDWNAVSGVAQILNKPSLATVATTGAYSDLSGTPTIPTVNNATLTITQGGTSKGAFTANASSDVTIDLDGGISISSIFPVGSCYITIGNTNPNTILGVGTWTLVTSSVITSVNTNVPIKGNGMTLGLFSNASNSGLYTYRTGDIVYLAGVSAAYGQGNGITITNPSGWERTNNTVGVTTDASKSGIVGTVTRTSTTIYIWQRTA